jgi:cold shock CspA family protein
MTGRIKSLSTMSPSGFIRADNGQNFYFRSSAVLPPGADVLATGQLVTFDLDEGEWPSAINVRVRTPQRTEPSKPEEHAAGAYLQYVGFEQTGNTRAYRFRRISRGEETREFIVSADLALFVKHRVSIQEGPALSLRLLSASDGCSAPAERPRAQSLSDADMTAHLARRPAKGSMRNHKENPAR